MRYFAILAIIGTTWGLTVPLTKIAVADGLEPFGLILWELAIATVGLGVYILATGQRFRLTRARAALFVFVGLAGTVLPGAFSYQAAAHLPGGVMSIVIALVPICALPVAIVIGMERADLRRAAGVIVGALAVVALFGPQTALPDPSKAGYVLVALVAPVCYGIEGNVVSWKGTYGLSAIQTLFGASVAGLLMTLPLTAMTGQWVDITPVTPAIQALFALSVLHILAYSAYIWLVGQAGSVFAAQVAYIVTLTGVLWSILLLGESYSGWIWSALVLILCGVALVLPRPRRLPQT